MGSFWCEFFILNSWQVLRIFCYASLVKVTSNKKLRKLSVFTRLNRINILGISSEAFMSPAVKARSCNKKPWLSQLVQNKQLVRGLAEDSYP